MTEAFTPTPVEFEAIVRFRSESSIRAKLNRLETGASDPTDDLIIQEATDRLSKLADEIGEEEVEQIVAKVENEYRQAFGDEMWRVLRHGTPEEQAAFAEARKNRERSRIELHNVFGNVEAGHWLHTHGMAERGLPELEIRGVPSYLADFAGRALRQVCEYMQEPGVEVRLGETMQIGPNSVVRFDKLPPIAGGEDHYEVERWAFAPVGMTCAECGAKACTGHPNQS
jgi:hypothetical protein